MIPPPRVLQELGVTHWSARRLAAWLAGTGKQGQPRLRHPAASPSENQRDNELSGVEAAPASYAWIVGDTNDDSFLTAFWNGIKWQQVRKGLPKASSGVAFTGVDVLSAKGSWVVGFIDFSGF